MSLKREPLYVESFLKAVYPEDTELCFTNNNMQEILDDATAAINEGQAERKRLREERDGKVDYFSKQLKKQIEPLFAGVK